MTQLSDIARSDISQMSEEELQEVRRLVWQRSSELEDEATASYDRTEYELLLKVKIPITASPADYDFETLDALIQYIEEEWPEFSYDASDVKVKVVSPKK